MDALHAPKANEEPKLMRSIHPGKAVAMDRLMTRTARVMMPAGQLTMGRARTVRPFAEGESTSSPTGWEVERAASDGVRSRLVAILSHESSLVPDFTIFLNPRTAMQRNSYRSSPD